MNSKEIAEILANMNEKEFSESFPIFYELMEIKKSQKQHSKPTQSDGICKE